MPHTIDERWPALPYLAWKDTYATLHMWTQILGKIALALAPPINHSWGTALQVTPRGLTTRRLSYGERSLSLAFDFIDHQLAIHVSDGNTRTVALAPKTVATFYGEVMAALRELGVEVRIWTLPSEIPDPIRFEQDTVHHSYDTEFASRFWRILCRVDEVLTRCRSSFIGKCSPTHFFWGGFDLAVTRFSGRLAPPREGPAFMREAYSHEVISHGFWPGSGLLLEPAFYAYAVPEPPGLKDVTIEPSAAYYHGEMGEFILPYEAVRTAASPEAAIQAFVESTYQHAADLAKWDRAALERQQT